MANMQLYKTLTLPKTNKSGGSHAQGDVCVEDAGNANAVINDTAGAYVNSPIWVCVEPNGVANNAVGKYSSIGYVPKINLSGSASLGDFFKTHTVSKQAVRHAAPAVLGDFGMVLATGTTPAAVLFGMPQQAAVGVVDDTAYDATSWNGDTTHAPSKNAVRDKIESLSAGSGALVLLEQHTASNSAQLDFTTFISSTYDNYLIEIVELALATNGAHLHCEIGTGGGPTYDTGNNYEWAANGFTSGGGTYTDSGSSGLARVFNALSNNAGYGIGSASITVTGLQSTSHRKTFHGTQQFVNSTPAAIYATWGMQWTTTGTAVTALRFIASSGNIASGTIRIYGIAKS